MKETKELVDALEYVGVKIASNLKDGFQITDLIALVDPTLFTNLMGGINGASLIPAELELAIKDEAQTKELAEMMIKLIFAIKNAAKVA